jgi:MscS family membrane protein
MVKKPIAVAHLCLFAWLVALLSLGLPARATTPEAGDLQRFPLSPPDISSPRATLATFLGESTAAINHYYAGDLERMRASAGRALQTLDADVGANDGTFLQGVETALYLLEILIRIELPPVDGIPGPDLAPQERLPLWTIPRTEIHIGRVEAEGGAFVGYRFSTDTVDRLPEFYQRVRALPVRPDYARYEGVVERFRLRPGFSAPGSVVSFVQNLPPVWFRMFAGEPWWKWTTLAAALVTALGLFGLAYRVAMALDGGLRNQSRGATLAQPVLAVIAILLLALLRYVAVDLVRLSGFQREVAVGALVVATHAAVIWLIFLLAGRVASAVIRMRDMGVYALDAQLVRLVSKLVAVLLALYALVNLAETLGVPVAPMLAGLGVGGLAVALAVRPTLENVVAGFVLFADAPVKVGEFCRFGDKMGTVEAIGLRSVRLRGIDRTVITVPNAEFCQIQLVNFTRRDAILMETRLQLRYETTPDQLRLLLARLRELLIRHPRVSPDPARVRFVEYASSSLDIEIFAYVRTSEFSEFLAIKEDLNLRIKAIVEACGTGFAFPSQTVYVERSSGPDMELARAAEAEVARWRSEGRLPFPDYHDGVRRELSDTLDYPPEGSSAIAGSAAAGGRR